MPMLTSISGVLVAKRAFKAGDDQVVKEYPIAFVMEVKLGAIDADSALNTRKRITTAPSEEEEAR